MRTFHTARFTFLLLALVLSGAATAQESPHLFRLDFTKGEVDPGHFQVDGALEEFVVTLDPSVLDADPDRIYFEMPYGGTHEAVRSHFLRYEGGRFFWAGNLRVAGRAPVAKAGDAAARTGTVILTVADGRLMGELRTPDGDHFRLLPSAGSAYRLLRTDKHAGGTCATEDAADLVTTAPLTVPLKAIPGCEDPPSTQTINLMALYMPELASSPTLEESTRLTIQSAVDQANLIHMTSETGIRYNLTFLGVFPDTPPPLVPKEQDTHNPKRPQTQQFLQWMSDPVPPGVAAFRDQYGADMVSVAIPTQSGLNCGAGNKPVVHFPSGDIVLEQQEEVLFTDKAFMVWELGCGTGDYTFAHEHGHNFGMFHNQIGRSSSSLTAYAYGFKYEPSEATGTAPFATVMACLSDSSNCERVPRFSNPDLFYNGIRIGHETFVGADPPTRPESSPAAHNACLAKTRAAQYANFRQGGTGIPTVVITSPADGTVIAPGSPFTLQGVAHDPEDGTLTPLIRWRATRLIDGQVIELGTGSPVGTSLSTGGQHVITASITDASQNTTEHSIEINIAETDLPVMTVDYPPHLGVVSGTFDYFGWATDASGVTNLVATVNFAFVDVDYGRPRQDVCNAYASLNDPNCPNVGFGGTVDTSIFPNGTNTLRVSATDAQGNTRTYARKFVVQNVVTATFTPTDDVWVWQLQPSSNYGTDTVLRTRAATTGRGQSTYIKFQVSGLTRFPQSAILRLRTLGTPFPSSRIYWITDTSWTERYMNWYNAPINFYSTWQLGALPANSWVEIDLTSIVRANTAFTFGFTAADVPDLGFYSRESAYPPTLTVVY